MSKRVKGFSVTAVALRNIFLILFALMLISSVILSAFGISRLRTAAEEVRTVVNEANAINQTNNRTSELWNELQDNQQIAEKASQVVAESQSYAYQDVIVRDLNNFAKQAGINITNYDFTTSQPQSSQAAPPPAATTEEVAPIPGGDAGPSTPAMDQPIISTLKTTSVTVSLETPVDYKKLLTFIHYIEQSLTKMQISKVSLSRAGQDNPDAVNSDALTIEVYIK